MSAGLFCYLLSLLQVESIMLSFATFISKSRDRRARASMPDNSSPSHLHSITSLQWSKDLEANRTPQLYNFPVQFQSSETCLLVSLKFVARVLLIHYIHFIHVLLYMFTMLLVRQGLNHRHKSQNAPLSHFLSILSQLWFQHAFVALTLSNVLAHMKL